VNAENLIGAMTARRIKPMDSFDWHAEHTVDEWRNQKANIGRELAIARDRLKLIEPAYSRLKDEVESLEGEYNAAGNELRHSMDRMVISLPPTPNPEGN
jgi:chromosome segregation ATPase